MHFFFTYTVYMYYIFWPDLRPPCLSVRQTETLTDHEVVDVALRDRQSHINLANIKCQYLGLIG